MKQDRPFDRRNRQWGSLKNAVSLRVFLSRRTKAILSALRNCEDGQISYGEVIERLAAHKASLVRRNKRYEMSQSINNIEEI